MTDFPRQKLDSLQVGRAFAAQFVVLYHVNAVMTSRLGQEIPSQFALAGHSGVDFFFVLSGFIIAFIHWSDAGQPDRASRYFYRRVTRIYPVFWVALLLTAIAQVVAAELEPNLTNLQSILRAIFLVPFDGYPPVVVAWTLSHELLFYLLFGLVIFFGRAGLAVMIGWWILCAVMLISAERSAFPVSFLSSPYNLLFGFGMAAAFLHSWLTKILAKFCLIAGLIIFGATIWADQVLDPGWRTVWYGLGATLIVMGAVQLEALSQRQMPQFLVYLGDASYSIYLIHSLTMAFTAIVVLKLGLVPQIPPALLAIGLFIAGNIGGLLLYHFAERPLMGWFKRKRVSVTAT